METEIVEAVRRVIGDDPAELHVPYLPPKTNEYVASCIASGQLSAGKWTRKFEEMICEFTGAKYAVAICNGTCALQIALICSGLTSGTIKIPALTFVATANAAVHAGLRPYFTEQEDANLPVDILGHKSNAEGLIRDSAASFGTKGITGTRIYSFNQNKIITCSLGGAVVTDDEALAKDINHRVTTARIPHPWLVEHDKIAYNYRISDLNAAIGIAQLEEIQLILDAKKALAERYRETFKKIDIEMVWQEDSNHWLNTITVENRDDTLRALHAAGYKARCMPTPLHMLKPYRNSSHDDLSKTMDIWRHAICLPSSPSLGMRFL